MRRTLLIASLLSLWVATGCQEPECVHVDTSGVSYAVAPEQVPAFGSTEDEEAEEVASPVPEERPDDVVAPPAGQEGADPVDPERSEPSEVETPERSDPPADPPADAPADPPPDAPEAEPEVVEVEETSPTRYPSDRVHSLLTPHVVENLRTIAALDEGRRDDVFAKIGASSFDTTRTLNCFAGTHVDRELMSVEALDALDLFLAGDAGNGDPFSRDAISAIAGDASYASIAVRCARTRSRVVTFVSRKP